MFSNLSHWRAPSARYVLAIGFFLAALFVYIGLTDVVGQRVPFLIFLPAILLASCFCGTGASIVTTALSIVCAHWAAVGPSHSFRIAPGESIFQFILEGAIGFGICWYGHVNRAARTKIQWSLEEAQRLREDYQSLFELSATAQAEVDARSGLFVRANSRFCLATGYKPAELMAMRFVELTHPEDRDEVGKAATRLLEGEASAVDLEKRCVCKSGEIIDALVSATVIKDSSGRPEKLVAAIRDLTLQKRVERTLRHAHEQLEQTLVKCASALEQDHGRLESLCSSIAHDLRAPLRAMNNFATLLEQRYGELLPAEGRRYTARITAASLRMDRLLIDLLEYGRVSCTDVLLTKVEPEELVHKLIEEIRQTPLGQGTEFVIKSPMVAVQADARLLQLALRNLIVNGLKFNRSAKPRIEVGSESKERVARIYVQDNGPGIDEKYHQLIFGVFQRLDESDGRSTGIGLAIVRTVAERMNGRAGLDSAVGQGSKFWLELANA